MPDVRLTAFVKGRVQGVGFRWWTRARALELGLVGSATNLDDGRVEVVAEGPQEAADRLLGPACADRAPPGRSSSWPSASTGPEGAWRASSSAEAPARARARRDLTVT
jgi:acylphosphatase